jgi:hypothetical protein
MKNVYLFAFMGQSNMAGRGVAALAPAVPEGWAYEFRAITRPDRLVPLTEPFGEHENTPDGVCETINKTGDMVASFVNSAYPLLQTPIVGVSCSKGGSSIDEWVPGTPFYKDGVRRLNLCRDYLLSHDYRIVEAGMVWCQGCTDADNGTPPDEYRRKTENFIHSFMRDTQIGHCFMIQIGNHRDQPQFYVPIQEAQEAICRDNDDIIMVSRTFKTFAARGLMKDEFHYLQPAYNEVGSEAGENAAHFFAKKKQKRLDSTC